MIARCFDQKREDYPHYGGAGIKVCSRWLEGDHQGLVNFYEDMGERPEGMTLDRIDPKGGYDPLNCRWADKATQSYNKKTYSSNTTGRTGVKSHKDGGYVSSINVNGKRKYLIYTKDFELAEFCRQEAEIHFYGYTKS